MNSKRWLWGSCGKWSVPIFLFADPSMSVLPRIPYSPSSHLILHTYPWFYGALLYLQLLPRLYTLPFLHLWHASFLEMSGSNSACWIPKHLSIHTSNSELVIIPTIILFFLLCFHFRNDNTVNAVAKQENRKSLLTAFHLSVISTQWLQVLLRFLFIMFHFSPFYFEKFQNLPPCFQNVKGSLIYQINFT